MSATGNLLEFSDRLLDTILYHLRKVIYHLNKIFFQQTFSRIFFQVTKFPLEQVNGSVILNDVSLLYGEYFQVKGVCKKTICLILISLYP